VTALQARNSARLTVVGSSELLEDAWFGKDVKRSVGLGGVGSDAKNVKTSNQDFVKEVTGWTFNEIGVLRVTNIEHHLNEKVEADKVLNPKIYRVKNDVVCSSDRLTGVLC
jgi:oligosaccharyltransferase complex subunit beta